jgi:two-component system, cell cycle sensor histidine kinase and response regulator CckA
MPDQPTPDERRFRALASSSVERIAEIDSRGNIVYVSPNHMPGQEHLLTALEAVLPEDQRAVMASFVQAFASGEPSRCSFRVRNLAGETRWTEATLTPTVAEDGERHVLVVSRDVTQAYQTSRELRDNRARFQLIAENAYDMIVEYDSQWRMVYSNDRVRAVLGIDQGNLDYQLDLEFNHVHPDDRAQVKEKIAAALGGGADSVNATYRVRRADGTWCWLDATLRRYTAADGQHNSLVIARDVTERVEAEQRLRESERRYRELVENAPLGIFVVQQRTIVFANAAGAALHGARSPEALCGTSVHDWIDDAQVGKFAEIVARSRRSGDRAATFTMSVPRKDGSEQHLAGVGTMISWAGAPAFQCIVRDVTELGRAQREQHRLSLQLQEARKLESLGVLAGGIAHDFNNLLAVILSSVRYASSNDAPPEERADALGDAEEASESAARLVKQLLAYAGRRSPEVRTIDLSELAGSLSELLSTALPGGVELRFDLAREPLLVHADLVQLEQVLMNLVLNAADAVGQGPGTVAIRTFRELFAPEQLAQWLGGENLTGGWYACLEVEDSGAGMDPETRARIFEPFFSTKDDGHGLGLSAVLGLVQGHGGAIDVVSAPGAGTRMRIFLPADARPVPTAEPRAAAPIVLVAEPDAALRGSAAETLRGAGMQVLEARDREQLLDLWARHGEELDAAVIDTAFSVPGEPPLWAALHAERPGVAILGICAPGQEPSRTEREALSALVRRPFTDDALRERLASLLAKREASR